ncbi:MAG: hypothetical protein FJ356_03300 [Thaumarchaeota archaeon]|nr:hypothetical protein [Nitrososphaerota archaeon]
MSYKVVKHVETLISHGKGDIGRLAYILEKLKQNKTLYVTDQKYLDKLLKAYPIFEREESSILKETFRTAQVNQELKTELKFAYEEIERLDAQVNQLKKEKITMIQQPSGQILIDSDLETQEGQEAPSTSTTSEAMIVESNLSEADVIRYARQSVAARSKSGMFKKEKIQETPLAWEKFLYPYYDIEMEITLGEIEKTKSKNDSITKTIRCRATVDGRTGVIVDVTKDRISYKYSFLNDLSIEEISLLYYVNPIQSFTLKEISGLGLGVKNSIQVLEKLTEKGYLKRKDGTGKYQTVKELQLPNLSKLKCVMEEHGITQETTSERRIKPSITAASLPLHLGKYWARCHVPASVLVYYPFYGITYDRKDYYRIEVIDGVTGKRQDYLERIVTVRPQNKIEGIQKIETIPQKIEDTQQQPQAKKAKQDSEIPKFGKSAVDEPATKVEKPKRGFKLPKFRKSKD